jgi:hypothetical protein
MKWIEALKKFNAGKGEWCVPKKGTREQKGHERSVENYARGNGVYKHTIRAGKAAKGG